MAKNSPKRGKSVRNGNAPSPYTKYSKLPYRYSFTGSGKIISVDFSRDEGKAKYDAKKIKKKHKKAA